MAKPDRILPWAQRRQAVHEFVESTSFIDPETGELYEPDEPPVVDDPEGDEDAR